MANKNKIISQAQKYISKGQWDKAIRELQKLIDDNPDDVRTLLKLGDVYSKKGDRSNATRVYKQVAESYAEQGFFLKAVAVYKQILKHDPTHLEVSIKLAELYEHLGLTSEATSQYQAAVQLYEEKGQTRESLEVLKRVIELDADNVAARIKLAESFSREGLTREATEQFGRAADLLRRQNRLEDYIKVAERLVYIDNTQHVVAKELAKIYLDRGDTKRALAKLQMSFKSDPRDIETLTYLAKAFLDLGQVQKTVFVYKELARIYLEEGRDLESRAVLEQILALDPSDADSRAQLQGISGNRAAAPIPKSSLPPRMPSIPPAPPPSYPVDVPIEPPEVSFELPVEAPIDAPMAPSAAPRPPSVAARPPSRAPTAAPINAQLSPLVPDVASPVAPSLRPPPAAPQSSPNSQIQKIMTETEVFIKYGLRDKALEHLSRVFDLDPNNVDAHGKVRDLFLEAGDNDRAAEAIASIIHIHAHLGNTAEMEQARGELARVSPGHALLDGQPGAVPSPTEDGGDPISIDIVEASGIYEVGDEGDIEDVSGLPDEPFAAPSVVPGPDLRADELLATNDLSATGSFNFDSADLRGDVGIPDHVDEDLQELQEIQSGVMMLSDVEESSDFISSADMIAVDDDIEMETTASDNVSYTDGPTSEEMFPSADVSFNQPDADVFGHQLQPPPPVDEPSHITPLPALEPALEPVPVPEPSPMRSLMPSESNPDMPVPEMEMEMEISQDFPLEPATPAPSPPSIDIEDELDEAAFLIEAELLAEARESVEGILSRSPDNERAQQLLTQLDEIDAEDTDASLDAVDLGPPVDDQTAQDAFDQGMMFREIGRIDDAIKEFGVAARAPSRAAGALEMIAHCCVEKGDDQEALSHFLMAYEKADAGPAQINLKYEIGNAEESLGNLGKALEWFRACQADDPEHRDVHGRIGALANATNGTAAANGESRDLERAPSPARPGKKSKISYL